MQAKKRQDKQGYRGLWAVGWLKLEGFGRVLEEPMELGVLDKLESSGWCSVGSIGR